MSKFFTSQTFTKHFNAVLKVSFYQTWTICLRLVERILHQTRPAHGRLLPTAWDSPLNVFWRHAITILILHGGDGFLLMVAWWNVSEEEYLIVTKLTKTAICHTLDILTDLSGSTTLLSTDRGQCCFTFSAVIGTEFTDWSTTGRTMFRWSENALNDALHFSLNSSKIFVVHSLFKAANVAYYYFLLYK